jgi:DNA-binding transcriptional MerR regulator
MGDLDISQVARRSGVPASTIRYYEERGLVRSVGRSGLRRIFDPSVVETLALIALGRGAGFSLNEIAEMIAADGRADIDRARLAAKADELDHTIKRMSALRDGLRHAAECPAPSHAECPKFQRIVRVAAHGRGRRMTASKMR